MSNAQLIDYIKKEKAAGLSDDAIKSALLGAGWSPADIEEGFRAATDVISVVPIHMSTEALLPTGSELLKNTWHVYKSRFGTFVAIAAVPTLFALVPIAFSLFGITLFPKDTLEGKVGTFIFTLAQWFVSIWSTIALIYAVKDRNEPIVLGEAYKRALGNFLSFVWVSGLTSLVMLGGFVLGIIPGIIALIWLSFASFVLIAEDVRGMNALVRSKEYIRGIWWNIFGRTAVIGVVCLGLFLILIVGIIALTFGIGFALGGIERALPAMLVVGSYATLLARIFIYPLFLTFFFLLYEHVRSRKLSLDPLLISKGKTLFKIFIAAPILLIVAFIGMMLVSISMREKSKEIMNEIPTESLIINILK